MIRWLAAALAALFLAAAPAAAQTVQQSGTVSPGHAGCWVTSGLLKDGGSPSNFQCNGLGLYNGTNSPLGISSQTSAGAPSGTWGTLTLGSTSSAASLTTLNSAGTAQPLNLAIGGDTTYVIGGTNWLSTIFGQQLCTTTGAVLYRDSGGTWKCLAPGTSGQVLSTQGANLNPQWISAGGQGTVTSITAGTGLTGGTITSSGTIALSTPVSVANGGTGAITLAAHGVLLGNGTTAINVSTPGVAGTVLQSNGAAADPTWNTVAGTGTVTSITAGSTAITVTPSPLITSGTVDCTTSTASQLGCSKPDGSTLTVSSGTLSAVTTTRVSALNPKMSVTVAAATGTFTADQVVVMTALNGVAQTRPSYSQAINLATTGAGGMDTGSAPVSGFVSLYAIAKADGTTSILACAVATSSGTIYGGANMPAGYTYSGLLGIWPTNGSRQFVAGLILDKYFYYQSFVSIASGLTGSTTMASQSISAGVPSAARFVDVLLGNTTGATTYNVAADATGTGARGITGANAGMANVGGVSAPNFSAILTGVPIITAQTVYWGEGSSRTTDFIYVTAYGW